LSRRRDELRRGIRSLIHDTSRELADLEGTSPPPAETEADPAPPPPDPPSLADAPSPAPRAAEAPPPPEVPASPPAPPAEDRDAPRDSAPPPPPPEPKEDAGAEASPPAPRKTPPAPRARRRRRRPVPDVPLDGVSPAQALSRTGVCFAYFLDHECWHVPDAYCNTALQVCILRRCPVYHLHKQALERRFAGKFKHFW
jgi:hypothetical protein